MLLHEAPFFFFLQHRYGKVVNGKTSPVQCDAYLMQGSIPTSADRLSISITRKVSGSLVSRSFVSWAL